MSDPPKTRYAKSGDVHIAYQVLGEGSIDLVWVPGFVSNRAQIQGLGLPTSWERPKLARECRFDRQPLILTLLPSLDLIEFGQRSLKLVIEEPHRIENFADGCRCSCPVSLSKGEDAVVAQISHYRGVRDFIVC